MALHFAERVSRPFGAYVASADLIPGSRKAHHHTIPVVAAT